jgi:hypothetical protein
LSMKMQAEAPVRAGRREWIRARGDRAAVPAYARAGRAIAVRRLMMLRYSPFAGFAVDDTDAAKRSNAETLGVDVTDLGDWLFTLRAQKSLVED